MIERQENSLSFERFIGSPLKVGHLSGKSKQQKGTLKLRDATESVHEPLIFSEVLISQLRGKVNM